jgi:hypothetical protein
VKVLITGGTGLLGEALIATAGEQRRLTVAHVRDYEVRRAGVDYFLTDVRDFGGYQDTRCVHTRMVLQSTPDISENLLCGLKKVEIASYRDRGLLCH